MERLLRAGDLWKAGSPKPLEVRNSYENLAEDEENECGTAVEGVSQSGAQPESAPAEEEEWINRDMNVQSCPLCVALTDAPSSAEGAETGAVRTA